MRWFANDDDGLTITDFLSVLVVGSYTTIALAGLHPQWHVRSLSLMDKLGNPVIVVVSYYFGKSVLSYLVPILKPAAARLISKFTSKRKE